MELCFAGGALQFSAREGEKGGTGGSCIYILPYIVLTCSVRFVSKERNCLPFLLYPLTIASDETKILSAAGPVIQREKFIVATRQHDIENFFFSKDLRTIFFF